MSRSKNTRVAGSVARTGMSRRATALAVGAMLLMVSGCTGPEGSPVLGAVFGLENAAQAPFQVGRIPDPAVRPGDRVIGQAANNPGQCIYLRGGAQRFRANCPDGYEL